MHNHLTRDQRIALAALLRSGLTQSQVADELGVHRSTISRELKRNKTDTGRYHARGAHNKSVERRKKSKESYRLIPQNKQLQKEIESLLSPLVSPETISHMIGIHHQTIYSWIYRDRRDLLPLLPQRGKKRRRYGSKRGKKQGWTRSVRSIHDMDQSHMIWEGDTIKGSTRARVLTHVEQTSLYLHAKLLPNGTADAVQTVLKQESLPGDILYDRGSEFALWKMIERDMNGQIYFCDPHAPWQRGKNENTNGRLRRVFPKKFNFDTITQSQLQYVVTLMNHTPRKTLGWRTPHEVYQKVVASQFRI